MQQGLRAAALPVWISQVVSLYNLVAAIVLLPAEVEDVVQKPNTKDAYSRPFDYAPMKMWALDFEGLRCSGPISMPVVEVAPVEAGHYLQLPKISMLNLLQKSLRDSRISQVVWPV